MTTDLRNTNAIYFGRMAQSRITDGNAVAAALWSRDAASIAFCLRPDLRLCFLCKPWPDGGCDFGCPCRDCEIGRKYEAFVTAPYHQHRRGSVATKTEAEAYLSWLEAGEVGRLDFEDEHSAERLG